MQGLRIMKIKSVRAVEIDVTPPMKTKPRVPQLPGDGFVSPMRRYPELARADWSADWKRTACVVTAEDGTWGFGMTLHSGPTVSIINDHL
jgi:L-rhamnonate dehydratase